MSTEDAFRQYACRKMVQNCERVAQCLGMLTEEQIWQRTGDASNSLGNLALHLAGNVRQWILHGVGGEADVRKRDEEFAARGGVPRDELLSLLKATVDASADVITKADLAARVHVQGYDLPAIEAIFHVVEHFSYHTGQIAFATKAITDQDLGFYGFLKSRAKPVSEQTP